MEPLLFSFFDSWTYEYQQWEKQYYALDADSESRQHPGGYYSSPMKYFQLAGAVTTSLKGFLPYNLISYFSDGGEHGKITEFHENGPFAVVHLL